MPKGKDYASIEEARAENLASAKKMINGLELMMQTGEVCGETGFQYWRNLLLDTANANIRYMEAQQREIARLSNLK